MITSGLRHGETIKASSTEHFSLWPSQSSQYVIRLFLPLSHFLLLKSEAAVFFHPLLMWRSLTNGRRHSFQSYLSDGEMVAICCLVELVSESGCVCVCWGGGCLRVFATTVSAFTGTKGQTGANCLLGTGDAAGLTQHFTPSS